MKFKTFITIHATVLAFVGLGTLFIAPTLMGSYGLRVEEHGIILARMLGSLMIANAVLSWLFRDVTEPRALMAIVYQQLVAWILTLTVSFIAQLDGAYLPIGWSNIVLYVIFSYAWVHYGFIKPIAKQ